MKQVVTLTINPAVDKSATAERIVPEHKIRCQNIRHDPGGGGINVSRAIKRLGGDSLAIFPSGGHTGKLLQQLLEQEQIRQHPVDVQQWTRENFVVVDNSTNQQFRFGMPGHEISEREAQQFFDLLKQLMPKTDYLVASGSLAPGLPDDFFAKIARIARESNTRFVLDTSGVPLEMAANEGVYLLKPNLGELSKLSGVASVETEMVDELARKIIDKGNCEVVVASLGGAGAALVSRDLSEHIPAPPVHKRSTVGAGDSMVGGMVWSLTQGRSLREMVRLGIACGTAATMSPGTGLFRREDADHLYQWLMTKFPPTGV